MGDVAINLRDVCINFIKVNPELGGGVVVRINLRGGVIIIFSKIIIRLGDIRLNLT